MRNRKHLGPVAGLVMSLALAGFAWAGFSSASWVSQPVGTNTPIFSNINFTTFNVWSCQNHNSDLQAYFKWMHHWPALPSTGQGAEAYYPCNNQAGTYTYTWSTSTRADYSVEYDHTNNSSVTTQWSASY